MKRRALSQWTNALVAVCIGVAFFGAALCVFEAPLLNLLYFDQVDPLFWVGPVPNPARAFQRFSYAVIGATVAGLGLIVGWMAHHGLRRGHRWVADGIAFGLVGWFLLDTVFSLIYGVWMNAIVNVVFFVSILIPTLMARRHTLAPEQMTRSALPG